MFNGGYRLLTHVGRAIANATNAAVPRQPSGIALLSRPSKPD
jgi:hypothetical protein